jgi:predicted site-specific integrase-resolvase
MNVPKIIYGDAAMAKDLGVSLTTVRTWRVKGLIPYRKLGHRSVIYFQDEVLAALQNAPEHKPESKS